MERTYTQFKTEVTFGKVQHSTLSSRVTLGKPPPFPEPQYPEFARQPVDRASL